MTPTLFQEPPSQVKSQASFTSLGFFRLQARKLPWVLSGLLVCVICLLVLIVLDSNSRLSPVTRIVVGIVLSGLTLLISLTLAFHVQQDERERESLRSDLRAAQDQTAQANRRLEAVLRVNRKVVEAGDEKEIVDFILQVAIQITGAAGASYVPIDDRSQPLSVVRLGEQPVPVDDDWLEYLASPAVRSRCSNCSDLESEDLSCPLLHGPYAVTRGVLCLPVSRGEREYGILNIYIPSLLKIDPDTRRFLRSIVDETALAIEGVRLRERELDSYHQLELARQKTDLKAALQDLLDELCRFLPADFAILEINPGPGRQQAPEIHLKSGFAPGQFDKQMVAELLKSTTSGQPAIVPFRSLLLSPENRESEGDLLVTTLSSSRQDELGFLLVGCHQPGGFLPRQFPLLQTTAGQAALLVENTRQMTELQVRTMLEERNRLAREIHDGLAQTIGFIKLQMAQMQAYLERGEKDRLQESMKKSYQAISMAYQEARFAIDGLRLTPDDFPLSGWLRQTANDFRENSSREVSVFLDLGEIPSRIPSEVQVQLIRIVQEALSNIRKHAEAKNVWINVSLIANNLQIEIRDDGQGFAPEDITGPSRYGLQGMRERADLIGAAIVVESLPAQGTRVVVRLPVRQEVVE